MNLGAHVSFFEWVMLNARVSSLEKQVSEQANVTHKMRGWLLASK